MGLADTLKPQMPRPLSLDIMSEHQIDCISFESDNVVGTNPETLLIALESDNTSDERRAAMKNLTAVCVPDRSKHNRARK